jgi:hypothetical protein
VLRKGGKVRVHGNYGRGVHDNIKNTLNFEISISETQELKQA